MDEIGAILDENGANMCTFQARKIDSILGPRKSRGQFVQLLGPPQMGPKTNKSQAQKSHFEAPFKYMPLKSRDDPIVRVHLSGQRTENEAEEITHKQ